MGPGLRVVALACVAMLAGFAASEAANPLPPELTQPVNDFAHAIDPQSTASLDHQIRALKAATGDVIVVATIDTFAPYADIREYAVTMFENHGRGIGDKGKDNGLLVLLAVKDRKVWVEVGYDLEQFVTDGYAGEVSRTSMAPAFAHGDYGGGLLAGASQFAARIAEARGVTLTGAPAPAVQRRSSRTVSPGIIIFLVFFLLRAGLMVRQSRMMGRGRWGAGAWSGWNSGIGPFGGGGGFGGGGFGGGFGGFGGGGSGGGGGGAGF